MIDIRIPKLGMSAVEVDVTAVHVRPHDDVKAGSPIAEIESEKLTFVIESEHDGLIVEVLAAPGDVRHVGDVIARLEPGA